MAIMVPDVLDEHTVSAAERRVFRWLRQDLRDDSFVLHSLGVTNHLSKLWAECDFVVLCHGGIFALEVKGGGVSCRDGIWTFTNRYGTQDSKREGPFAQASSVMYAIKKEVEQQEPELAGLLWGYGVVIPDDVFTATGPEIEPGVVWDRRDVESGRRFDSYISRLSSFWQDDYGDKHVISPRLPDRPTLEKIRRILRPEIKTSLNLASSLNKVDQDLVELTDQQVSVLRGMHTNERTLVYGAAGTGKTLLAVDWALDAASKDKRVLLLCFNRLLARHLQEAIQGRPGAEAVTVSTIHSWYRSVIDQAAMGEMVPNALDEGDWESSDFYAHTLPAAYVDAVLRLEGGLPSFDTIVVDEAQDLLTQEHLDALDVTVAGGLRAGSWHLFMDPLQDIFGQLKLQSPSLLEGVAYARWNLTVNCRNTKTITITTAEVSGVRIPLEGRVTGGEAHVVYHRDGPGLLRNLDTVVEELLKQGLKPEEIIVLSTRRRDKSAIAGLSAIAGRPIRDLTSGERPQGGIEFCTMQAFKGLDRKAVIAVDVVGLDIQDNAMLHYCGLSRARTWLTVLLQENEREPLARHIMEMATRIEEEGDSAAEAGHQPRRGRTAPGDGDVR